MQGVGGGIGLGAIINRFNNPVAAAMVAAMAAHAPWENASETPLRNRCIRVIVRSSYLLTIYLMACSSFL